MEFLEFFFSSIIGLTLFVFSLAIYFLPTIIAVVRKKRNTPCYFFIKSIPRLYVYRLGGGACLGGYKRLAALPSCYFP